ncbi:MAG: AAA family ATPase [Candidatus Moranbacteria bacterium]|jgi:ATP-dependent DNA helicase PIF1|nr:AAA family ATPase [Candidatus Moranbacteria bacterium]MBP9801254.1 AAA family ATPase [Candidatus Moranbacteria bacterium]
MTQAEALAILRSGAHAFLTGEAGSGKTHTINAYTDYLREQGIDFAVTASTGIAATHIHGMTLHAWSGIGIARSLSEDDLQALVTHRYISQRIKKARVLIIDEISMLDASVFDMVERICRAVKKGQLPFGGMQVVVVGDFFQLPPIAKEGEFSRFAFESDTWQWLDFKVCYLTEQHRQEDDMFLELLSAVRSRTWGDLHQRRLETRLMDSEDELPDEKMTRLFSHNADVDRINQGELSKLRAKTYRFVMAERGPEKLVDSLKRGCLSPEQLELKEGASVMFTKNNQGEGFVNGTLGVVIGFEGGMHWPIVRTHSGNRIVVEPTEWMMMESDTTLAKITQLPLRLAWAMTIHKSQGVSLDAAVMDLSQAFEFGQGYVALSRVKRLSGVYLIGINERALEVHPRVFQEDQVFRKVSQKTLAKFSDFSQEEQENLERNFILIAGGKRREENKKQKGALVSETLLEKVRRAHARAYRPWTNEEEEELKKLFNRGKLVKEIAIVLGRQIGGVRSRIKKLGLKEI